MHRLATILSLLTVLLLFGCATETQVPQEIEQQDAASLIDALSFALSLSDQSDIAEAIRISSDGGPGDTVTGTLSFMGYLAVLDLVIGKNCLLDGKIYVYGNASAITYPGPDLVAVKNASSLLTTAPGQGSSQLVLIAVLTVEDGVAKSDKFPYIGKLNFKSAVCQQQTVIQTLVPADSCAAKCSAGSLCQEDVERLLAAANYAAMIEKCVDTSTDGLCYEVSSDPLCQAALEQHL